MSDTQRHKRLRNGQQSGAVKKPSDPPQVRASAHRTDTSSPVGGQQGEQRGATAPSESASGSTQQVTEPSGDGPAGEQQDVDEESEDSDVSEGFEDEEEDEEEEEDFSNDQNNLGNHRCSVCDLQLPSKFKLQDHMNLHTGARPYCCAECGKRFCQIYNYRVHLRTHAKAKAEQHWCRICLKGFSSQEELTKHLSRNHFEEEFYECDLCKRVFTSLKDCEKHVQMHKSVVNIVCDVCSRSFRSEKSLARHKKRRCLCSFKCTDCGETFVKKNSLLKHSFSHLGLLPYTCLRCRCHFRLAKLYRLHKCDPQRIHCVACLREFLNQEDFQQHKKDTGCWGNQEPNQKVDEIRCLECGQRFDTSDELKQHASAHQRVLKCAECGKGFRSALLLMSHMGGHAGQSPCFCQRCGLGFPHQQNYDIHLKSCGQTPPSEGGPKKRHTSKSSQLRKNPQKDPKPNTNNPTSNTKSASISPAVPAKDPRSPELRTGRDTSGSGPSEGLWTLNLEEKQSSGVNLVLFVPVDPAQSSGLSLPPAAAAVQALPQASLAVGAQLNTCIELLTGTAGDDEAPLDLSKKTKPLKSEQTELPLLPVKSEPKEFEVTEQNHCSKRNQIKSDLSTPDRLKTETSHVDKKCQLEPSAPSPLTALMSFCGTKSEVKKETET